jgi:hypothetical protein
MQYPNRLTGTRVLSDVTRITEDVGHSLQLKNYTYRKFWELSTASPTNIHRRRSCARVQTTPSCKNHLYQLVLHTRRLYRQPNARCEHYIAEIDKCSIGHSQGACHRSDGSFSVISCNRNSDNLQTTIMPSNIPTILTSVDRGPLATPVPQIVALRCITRTPGYIPIWAKKKAKEQHVTPQWRQSIIYLRIHQASCQPNRWMTQTKLSTPSNVSAQ